MDRTLDGPILRIPTLIDKYTKEALDFHVA